MSQRVLVRPKSGAVVSCLFLLSLVLTSVDTTFADDFAFKSYVARCKTELEFDTIPQMDCRSVNFRPKTDEPGFGATNDWVAHRKVNDDVDAVYACRWVSQNEGPSKALSGEMIVHNRKNGNTCFFDQKTELGGGGRPSITTTKPVSPTHANATEFWEDLSIFTNKVCTECHAAGPYIASPQIVGALAKFGLINDGHDTFANKYFALDPELDPRARYKFQSKIYDVGTTGCAQACHAMVEDPNVFEPKFGGQIQMPSISRVVTDTIVMGEMPPDDPYSDYRWLNRDTGASGYGDYERLSDYKRDKEEGLRDYSAFYCNSPSILEAHRTDSAVRIRSNDFPDKIETFNLHDGLICNNADQPSGKKCTNYQTRYKCDGEWTNWRSLDSPSGSGENERRSKYEDKYGLCNKPSDIQARYEKGSGWKTVYGPRDRLRQFDRKGLYCRNEDQPDGKKCNNYVVRFICD